MSLSSKKAPRVLSDADTNLPVTRQAAFLQGYESTGGRWHRVAVDASGRIAVVATSTAGTPLADGDPNPTTVRYGANLLGWNGATWDRVQVSSGGVVKVDVTKLPAAAALADNLGNPTTTQIGAMGMSLNALGTSWERSRSGIAGPVTSVAGFSNVLAGGVYNAAGVGPLTTGNWCGFQLDVNGNLRVTNATAISGENFTDDVLQVSPKAMSTGTGAWTPYSSNAKVGTTGQNIKASGGRLRDLHATNTAATAYFLLAFNKATPPVNGDVPVRSKPLAAAIGAEATLDLGSEGQFFGTGISYAISTTAHLLTLPAASDVVVDGRFN